MSSSFNHGPVVARRGFVAFAGLGLANAALAPVSALAAGTGSLSVRAAAKGNPSYVIGNSHYSLAGITFGIYGDEACQNRVGKVTCRADGTTDAAALPDGTYWVKEDTPGSDAGLGYLVDGTVREATVSGGAATLDVELEPILVRFPGVFKEGFDNVKLKGAVFDLLYFVGSIEEVSKIDRDLGREALGILCSSVSDESDGYCYFPGRGQSALVRWPWDLDFDTGLMLPLGTIAIREVWAPDGYREARGSALREASDDGTHRGPVEVNWRYEGIRYVAWGGTSMRWSEVGGDTDASYLTVLDCRKDGAVQLEKSATGKPSYVDGNPCYSLEGIRYRIYGYSGGVYNDLVLDANGTARTANGAFPYYESGGDDYWLEEKEPVDGGGSGFLISKERPVFRVSPDRPLATVKVSDDPITDEFPAVRKVDGSGAPVAGATFRLVYFKAKSVTGLPAASATGTSGADGSVSFDLSEWPWQSGGRTTLPLGTITVAEVAAPDGYAAVDGAWTRTSVDDGTHTGSLLRTTSGPGSGAWAADGATLTVTNDLAEVMLPYGAVHKYDPDTEAPVAGAEFEVTNAGKAPVTIDGRDFGVGDVVTSFVTDEAGNSPALRVARAATYRVRESRAPEGYVLGLETHTIHVAADGSVTVADK